MTLQDQDVAIRKILQAKAMVAAMQNALSHPDERLSAEVQSNMLWGMADMLDEVHGAINISNGR
jgi:hypothetical protein